MEADHRREGVKGVGEPSIELVQGGRRRGGRYTGVFDGLFPDVQVGLVPHGSGGARSLDIAIRRMRIGTWADPEECRVEASPDRKAWRIMGLAKARSMALGLMVPERRNLV